VGEELANGSPDNDESLGASDASLMTSSDANLTAPSTPASKPARKKPAARKPASSGQQSADPKHTVLLVEDNPINLRICTSILRQLGAKVVQAADGDQAIEISTQQPFALILMDLQMPICDGITATKAIRVGMCAWRSEPV
jgi:PleD family two-component response regulator